MPQCNRCGRTLPESEMSPFTEGLCLDCDRELTADEINAKHDAEADAEAAGLEADRSQYYAELDADAPLETRNVVRRAVQDVSGRVTP